jgi:PAS domain S-box-containing protein
MQHAFKTNQALTEELESLRQRIRELERIEVELKKGETEQEILLGALQKSEEQYRQLVENAFDCILFMDLDGIIRFANHASLALASPVNLIGLSMREFLSPDQIKRHEELLQTRREGVTKVYSFIWDLFRPDDHRHVIMDVRSSMLTENGKPSGVMMVARDVTDQKLREGESLTLARNLAEANIALRVVLARRDEDQKMLEEKIQANVNDVILPFIRSLNRSNMEERDRHYLDLLESNLKSILSPFVKNVSGKYPSLSPKEKQIAEMIRQGKRSKEIAEMIGISVRTVDVLRYSVRKKLGLNKKNANLQSFLGSI